MPYIGNQHNVGDHINNFKVLDDISSYTATFDGSATSAVDTTNNTIRVPLHRFIQGQRVTYTNGGGGNINGLTTGTAYFVSFDSANTIKLATSLANANSNTVINLSSVGSGTSHTLNAAFDGINTKFKLSHGSGTAARLNNATQINVAINNVVQRPNLDPNNFTDGFALEDNHKIVFQTAPTNEDIFWGSIIANTIENFDLRDNEVDNFTGNGSATEFTLSTIPANNESVIVTIDGVLQHPSDKDTVRAYTLIDSIIQFTAAPANNAEIQVRHIGFAGASTNDVSGFYGRTGNVALTANDHITTGDITARNINASGILTASSASFGGNVSIGGTLTYEDVSNIDSVGIITARDGIDCNGDIDVDGHTNLDNVSVAGVTTFSDTVNVGTGVTIFTNGRADFTGFTTFSSGAHIPFNKGLVIGPNSLYGQIGYLSGFSGLQFQALNQMKFSCWDGSSIEQFLYANGVGAYVDILGTNMGTSKAPLLRVQGNTARQIKMFSSDGSNLTERFRLSQSGFNFTGLSTHTGNFDLDGDLDVDGHTNLDNVSIAGVTTFASGNVQLASDSQRLQLGSGQDLWMYHTGTSGGGHGLIQNDYGVMYMLSDSFTFRDRSTNHDVFKINENNAVSLYYQNSAKLSTTSIGAQIDTTLRLYGAAGTGGGRLRLAEGAAYSEIRGVRNTDTSSELWFGTEIGDTVDYRAKINTGGHFIPGADSTYDLGLTGTRWRNVYADTLYGFDLDIDGHTNLDNVSIAGVTTTTDNINIDADNKKLQIGDSQDLQLFHDGGHSRITNTTGILKLTAPSGSSVRMVKPDDSGNVAVFHIDAETHLYYNGAHKFSTISDGIQVVGNATINDSIIHNGDTNTKIRFPAADNISFEAGGVERLRIDNVTGNQVVAKDPTAAVLRVENSTAATSQVSKLDLAPANSLSGVQLKATSEEDFSTGANRTAFFSIDVRKDGTFYERLRITSTGAINCGHGDAVNLHGSTTTGINLNGNNNSGQIVANASNNRALIIGRQGSYGQVIEFFQGTNTNEAAITIPAADTLGFETNGTERLRIQSGGNLQIGVTADPGNTLRYVDIGNYNTGTSAGSILRLISRKSDGSSSASADFVKYKTGGLVINNNEAIGTTGFISFGTATGGGSTLERVRIHSNGQTQIGGTTLINSNPLLTLGQSSSTVGNQFHLVNNGSADLKMSFISAGKQSRAVGIDVSNDNFFIGRDTSDQDITISSAGKVGINKGSPVWQLDVANPNPGNDSKQLIQRWMNDGQNTIELNMYGGNVDQCQFAAVNNEQTISFLTGRNSGSQVVSTETTLLMTQNRDLWCQGPDTSVYGGGLFIGRSASPYGNLCALRDSNYRPIIYMAGKYPEITLAHEVPTNGSHAAVLRFVTYVQSNNTATGSQFCIGTNGPGTYLDIGHGGAGQNANAHAGISNFSGTTRLRVTLNGVEVYGTFSVSSTKNFKISHPLETKTETHDLVHSSIEGPQADLIYRGVVDLVDGTATVNVDTAARMTEGTFASLCTNVSCFTSNETDWTAVKGSVSGNTLTITAQDNTSTATVSWMVVGERKDKAMIDSPATDENGRLITEHLKSS